jgi:hypothetical protein
MSLLSELEARGVTAEDLEKAASVRYFEKAAAAEGVNLDELDEGQVEELYASFIHNRASAVDDHSKEASAMNPDIIDLFEKTAAAEGIDLGEMDDAELAELYEYYVENVLPEQIGEDGGDYDEEEKDASYEGLFFKTAAAEGIDLDALNQYELEELYEHYIENVLPEQIGGGEKSAADEEAYEKLAEAEILGRHMARSYMDEMDKEATSRATKAKLRAAGMAGPEGGSLQPTKNKKGDVVRNFSKSQQEDAKAMGKQRRGAGGSRRVGTGRNSTLIAPHTREFRGQSANLYTTKAKLNAVKRFGSKYKVPLAAGGALVAGLGGGYLAGREKAASVLIEELAEELALEMLADAGYDV